MLCYGSLVAAAKFVKKTAGEDIYEKAFEWSSDLVKSAVEYTLSRS